MKQKLLTPAEKEKMLFVKEYEGLIREAYLLIGIANGVQEILKEKGLHEKTKNDCMKLFDQATAGRTLKFKGMLDVFLTSMGKAAEGIDKILCSSDILESSFGKYKNYISANKSVGITDLSLSIPAFSGKLEQDEIIKAMEGVKVRQLKEWSTLNIGDTQTKKRRE